MAIDREVPEIPVRARMSWVELLATLEAAAEGLGRGPELARDAARLETLAKYLRRRAVRGDEGPADA